MASLTATVAGLASGIERAAVGSSAIPGNVAYNLSIMPREIVADELTQLAASIALHGLSLTVTGKMVWSTALVAGSRTSAASETAPETSVAATGSTGSTGHAGVRAITRKMASKAAAIASSTRAGATQTKSRAVRLDVTESLTVVALFG